MEMDLVSHVLRLRCILNHVQHVPEALEDVRERLLPIGLLRRCQRLSKEFLGVREGVVLGLVRIGVLEALARVL